MTIVFWVFAILGMFSMAGMLLIAAAVVVPEVLHVRRDRRMNQRDRDDLKLLLDDPAAAMAVLRKGSEGAR